MYSARQPDAVTVPVDYLSGDFSWSWGADRAAVEGRVLDGRGKTWDLMAWGFTKAGEMRGEMPWTFKPVTHLCQEVSEVVALGGAVMVYNTPQRSGWLTGWQQERIAAVAAFCRARQSTCWRSEAVPQAAVLHLPRHFYRANVPLYNLGAALDPVEGALHALLETHRSTDILTPGPAMDRLGDYPLVVVPEQSRLVPDLVDTLEAYARAGSCVVLSGAHLAHECPALLGVEPAGGKVEGTVYLAVGAAAVGVPGPWQPVTPVDAEVWARRLAQPDPERDVTEDVLVTRRRLGRGSVVGIHGPVFRRYRQGHYPLLRRLIAQFVARLEIGWLVTAEAPPWVEVILRQREGRLLVNLINRGAGETLHGERVMVEDLPPVRGIRLAIRREHAPRSVTLVPGGGELAWRHAGGVVRVTVPEVAIHSVVVVDEHPRQGAGVVEGERGADGI
jgi:hypothetical protein